MNTISPRGFTITECCVTAGLLAVAIAVVAPPLSTVGCSSKRVVSRSNLATLAQAHVAYAGDWSGRQFTLVSDDVGAFGGCAGFVAAGNCLPDVLLGQACDGTSVGYPLGCQAGAACQNFPAAVPLAFSGSGDFGAYRLPNAVGFQAYVDGRFYSPTFYAPDDVGVYDQAEPYFDVDCEYAAPPAASPIFASYVRSPASMYSSKVLARQTGYKNPNSLADGYTSPPLGDAAYPELKLQMLEHNTIENTFGPCNPNYPGCVPFRFNQVYEGRPLGLMYDGSVRIVSPREAMESDLRAKATTPAGYVEKGLWLRGTPFGASGIGGLQSADFFVDTSYFYLTGDGILGRDVLP